MKADIVVIQKPEKQSVPRRIAYAVLTVVAWILWGWLWLPAVHALALWLGLPARYLALVPDVVLGSAREFASIIWLAPVSLAVFVAWSLYESWHRRRTRQRRNRPRPVPLPEAAASLGSSVPDAIRLQESRRAVVHVDDEDHIVAPVIETGPGRVVVDLAERRQRNAS